jgi:hypothetical protein
VLTADEVIEERRRALSEGRWDWDTHAAAAAFRELVADRDPDGKQLPPRKRGRSQFL